MSNTTDLNQPETRPTAAPLEPLVGHSFAIKELIEHAYRSDELIVDLYNEIKHLRKAVGTTHHPRYPSIVFFNGETARSFGVDCLSYETPRRLSQNFECANL